ncbi:response regulator transcription factor [Clostridium perfringens]|uniref:response regulator transcription factor n=1 Tax=Clostridium perfringens TaxID=1502 RepID=UPI001A211D0D|nr:response regulator transcription factor [Clostridium perfringens]EGT5618208.1 response regulator transcription factor [Clostridium perfringens]EHK2442374.1 response regulator transcription factor [Clostridium perfringens]MDT9336595.1 response regulator transcription factor [Clostridium perfringens]MDT9344351.1 response regulator transcription factor [Clostridium perfringens]MDT9347650.1 response regulator transcription factor [Clostridium perfringens]
MKILVVDDEINILKMLKITLEVAGHEVLLSENALSAIDIILENEPDVIILDAMLPDIDGFNLIPKIKKVKDIPIIMLTAKCNINDKLLGLQLGVDDYITKPFNSTELLLRLNIIKKRSIYPKKISHKNEITLGNLKLFLNEKKLLLNNEYVDLTFKEFQLLSCLCKNKGKVFTRDELLIKIWGYDFEGTNRTVDMLIQRLRKKLGSCQNYIKTIYGLGYKIDVL